MFTNRFFTDSENYFSSASVDKIFKNMIEIQAKLLRNQSAVFLSGEKVDVLVTFTNRTHSEQRISQSNS